MSSHVCHSTFTTQSWNEEIAVASVTVEKALSSIGISAPSFNTATSIVYDSDRSIMFHRDNIYTRDGKFQASANSQVENTVTAVLCFGDSRELIFQEYRNRDVRQFPQDVYARVGPIAVGVQISVELEHGDVFVLMPNDEEPRHRTSNTDAKTFFKHGSKGVCGKEDCVSLGLALRSCSTTLCVDASTGMIVHDGDGVTNEEQASKLLKSYAKSNEKEEGDRKRKKSQLQHISPVS